MTQFGINRRGLMMGSALGVLAAPAILTGAQAAAEESVTAASAPAMGQGIRRMKLGAFAVTVVNDGTRPSDKPNETFGTNQPPEKVAELLKSNFLPENTFVNGFSPVLVETGEEKILFDTGMGEMGQSFGGGRLKEGLAAAGVKPEDITMVVLTHLHPDHIGGLMAGGQASFPNARYVIGQAEYDFWNADARVGTPAETTHQMVRKVVTPIVEKAKFIGDGDSVVSGITAVLAPGHTPGHMGFMLESDGRQIVLTADTANHYVLSLQRPDWEVRFDADKAKAAETRKKMFDMIATDRIAFIGYHMPFPAIGFVEKQDEGYRFVPASYQFDI
jgi:glyoxylase-like metal-dependent hydrolase (beta-lactamase superfamily II)